MTIKNALNNILEGNLDEMRQNFSSALTTKAVEKLEERKIDIAKNYFGQLDELRKLKNTMDVVSYVGKAKDQIEKMKPYDTSREGEENMKRGAKRVRGLQLLVKKAKKEG